MSALSQSAYDSCLKRVNDAKWLIDHVPEEHRLELCQRVPLCGLIVWIRSQRRPVDVERLRIRSGVSRATAFRLRAALASAGENVMIPAPSERRSPLKPPNAAARFVVMPSFGYREAFAR